MNTTRNLLLASLILCLIPALAASQGSTEKPKYDHASQKDLIPSELGRVYLGMPLTEFAKTIDLSKANVDDRFGDWSIEIPFTKGNVTFVNAKVHGIDPERSGDLLVETDGKIRGDDGKMFDGKIKRLRVDKIPAGPFVYALYVEYKKTFDLRKHLKARYGTGQERDPNDEYHFADTEWNKVTKDGLRWLIRVNYLENSNVLALLGRISGTEWGLDDID